MIQSLICEIDGVLADSRHRLPTNWDSCAGDAPIEPVIQFVRAASGLFRIIYLTWRPESVRETTISWLQENQLPWDGGTLLLMRPDGDRRRNERVVKWELLRKSIPGYSAVFAVIEDSDATVKMWRSHGLLCLQPKHHCAGECPRQAQWRRWYGKNYSVTHLRNRGHGLFQFVIHLRSSGDGKLQMGCKRAGAG